MTNDKNQNDTDSSKLKPIMVGGIPEVTPEMLRAYTGPAVLIDVRRPEEFNGELSHIPGAKLVSQGPELDAFLMKQPKDLKIVFVCRSGARSGRATLQARGMGFAESVNLQGGMLLWNEKQLPTASRK